MVGSQRTGACRWHGRIIAWLASTLAGLTALGPWSIGAGRSYAQESVVALSKLGSAASESKTAAVEEIQSWIEQLAHDDYPMRQAAAEKLLDAGAAAREPLLALVEDPDPETRAAARRLVALIDRTEFERRLEAFAADVEGRNGLTLPGWEQFREMAGGDSAARALFVEMQRQEGPMISAVFGVSAKPVSEMWEERLMRLVQWQATADNRTAAPPLGSCAAILFLGSVTGMEVSDRGAMLIEHLIQRPPLREVLLAGNYRATVRRLVVGWVLECPNQNENLLGRRIYLASINELKEVLPLALAVVGGEDKYASVQSTTKAAALLLIGQFGGREHIELLEPLIEDSSVCMPRVAQVPGQPVANVQIRDVALVVLLTLTDQRPADYGYVNARMQAQQMYQLQTLHLANDNERAAAAAKWRAWRAAEESRERRVESQEPDETNRNAN
jgi:hypothetical protein